MSQTLCEFCGSGIEVSRLTIPSFDNEIDACQTCSSQITHLKPIEPDHWHCLNESIWSENPSVKMVAWRILNQISNERWAQDLLEQLYLDEDQLELAQDSKQIETTQAGPVTKDSNGTPLADGDAVTLIKDLEVKGAGFTAKRGTLVKRISLTGDPGLVEGKINGTQIVLKTQFLKKSI